MLYSRLVEAYEKIEATTKRIEMTDCLVRLFRETPKELIHKVVYLTQGKIYPDYLGIELGIAERMAMRSLSIATGVSFNEIEEILKKLGDIGKVAEYIASRRKQATLFQFAKTPLTVEKVYETLDKIAKTAGEGSQDLKIRLLAGLLNDATPKEAKYLVRTVTGKLRLGIADMTILDALSIAFFGTKDPRPILERAYNLCSDLGKVARLAAEKNLDALKSFKPIIGIPVRPMLAERLSDPKEILAKLNYSCAAEFKYDGERVQIHKNGEKVKLFSRRLEDITHQYPDVCEYVKKYVKANRAILEAEIVAIDPDTLEMRPFQELMHRKRRHNIAEAMAQYPVALYFFDIILLEDEDLTQVPYVERRKKLEEVVVESDHTHLAERKVIEDQEDLEKFFEYAVEQGCEGIMCKSTSKDSVYQAGNRGWLWIKYKRDYAAELTDTLDLVVVGAFYGKGKRAGKYGALLMAAYDPQSDKFYTVCKVGTGFTDEDLEKLPEMLKEYKIEHRHPRVVSEMEADVWFVPAMVLEITGAEITLSPLHTCAKGVIRPEAGLALRFPRFTGRWRTDKSPEDATTVKEIIEMYRSQKRIKVAG